MNILLIYHDHAYLTLSLPDPTKSQSDTSITRIYIHACASRPKFRPGAGAGGCKHTHGVAAPPLALLASNLLPHHLHPRCIIALVVLGLFPS
jgi:hypothetical protein